MAASQHERSTGIPTSFEGVTLRPAVFEGEPNDLEFLERVYAESRTDEMALVSHWNAAERSTFLRGQFVLQHEHYREHYPSARYDVICENGRAIGRLYVDALVDGQPEVEEGAFEAARVEPDEIRVMDIALLLEERGRGIGRRLIEDILADARVHDRRVSLHVEETNRARRLYHALGFRDVRDIGIYKLMEWSP